MTPTISPEFMGQIALGNHISVKNVKKLVQFRITLALVQVKVSQELK